VGTPRGNLVITVKRSAIGEGGGEGVSLGAAMICLPKCAGVPRDVVCFQRELLLSEAGKCLVGCHDQVWPAAIRMAVSLVCTVEGYPPPPSHPDFSTGVPFRLLNNIKIQSKICKR
jgi:hypothetical protein